MKGNMYSRRFFIGGCVSLGALAGCGKILMPGAASAAGAKLKFGVLSDIHLQNPGDEHTFLKALEYFRQCRVDGVLIAGDIANAGEYLQLKCCADCWYKVFPNDTGLDGQHVEKLFIYGNHCIDGWTYAGRYHERLEGAKREAIGYQSNRRRFWESLFNEEYHDIWVKELKGYTFIGAHWQNEHRTAFPEWLDEHGRKLDPSKPFFYTQHAHPRNTCFGAWAWGADNGDVTKALFAYPNAIAITGHSHYPLTDERSVWQGEFTSINGASLYYASTDYSLRDNFGGDNGWGYTGEKAMPHRTKLLDSMGGRHGMVFAVFDDHIAIERREFVTGRTLGDDWVLPLPAAESKPFAYAEHAARRVAPQFAADAKITVEKRQDEKHGEVYDVKFPAAKTVDKCRVLEYEVTATLVEDEVDLIQQQKRVFATDYFRPDSENPSPELCTFAASDLKLKGHYRFSARPIECFGKKGGKIESDVVVI